LATFVVGANNFSGTKSLADDFNRDFGATTFNYDLQLNFETSFTGKDLLLAVLRAGNFDGGNNVFGGTPTGLSTLETAFQEEGGKDVLGIDKLYYQFPVAKAFTFTLGAKVGQEDMLAVWPSAYPSDTVLDVTTLNGAPAAYNKNLGPGAGVSWATDNGFSVSANYVAANAADSNPTEGGIGTSYSSSSCTVQLAYEQENWNIAAIWSSVQNPVNTIGGFGTAFFADDTNNSLGAFVNAWGIGGSWQPQDSGWIPSISAGYGYNSYNNSRTNFNREVTESQSWNVGLNWSDVFLKGNNAGMAVGQPIFCY
jgi:hypothetical protein